MNFLKLPTGKIVNLDRVDWIGESCTNIAQFSGKEHRFSPADFSILREACDIIAADDDGNLFYEGARPKTKLGVDS